METRWIGVHVSLAANCPAIKNLSRPPRGCIKLAKYAGMWSAKPGSRKTSHNNDKRRLRTSIVFRVFLPRAAFIRITVIERSRVFCIKSAL